MSTQTVRTGRSDSPLAGHRLAFDLEPLATAAAGPLGERAPYDFAVFIGRFRFFHNGHLAVLRRALKLGRHAVVLVGSCKQARGERVPLVFEEARWCILSSLAPEERARVTVLPLIDRYNDVRWVEDVQAAVHAVTCQFHRAADGSAPRVCLIGHSKDESSYYLRLFPQWAFEEAPSFGGLSATPIRADYFDDAGAALAKWAEHVPPTVRAFLAEFAETDVYRALVSEAEFVRRYKERWACAPYEPSFLTADGVIVCAGHILLVERRSSPGKGLLALPGGYVQGNERIRTAMVRELREETRLKVPAGFIEGSIQAQETFDYPYRDPRGRVVTTGFLVNLKPDDRGLPKVRGGDDARDAFWLPVSDIEPESMFSDHYHVIQTLLGYAR